LPEFFRFFGGCRDLDVPELLERELFELLINQGKRLVERRCVGGNDDCTGEYQ
jgi:hypothetical protein